MILLIHIRTGNRRIPIPVFLPLFLLLVLVLELLGFIPFLIYAMLKQDALFLRLAGGFYLTRFFVALILWGRHLAVNVSDANTRVTIKIFP